MKRSSREISWVTGTVSASRVPSRERGLVTPVSDSLMRTHKKSLMGRGTVVVLAVFRRQRPSEKDTVHQEFWRDVRNCFWKIVFSRPFPTHVRVTTVTTWARGLAQRSSNRNRSCRACRDCRHCRARGLPVTGCVYY
eukprot:753652-Hanusia_phi.AAC.1